MVDLLIFGKKSFSLVLRECSQVLLKAAAGKVDIEVEITVVERASRNEAVDQTLRFILNGTEGKISRRGCTWCCCYLT